MRFAALHLAVPLLLCMPAAAISDEARVQAQSAVVYKDASDRSTIVATAHQGDVVHVELSVQGRVEWCSVRFQDGEKKVSGFVACDALDRGPRSQTVLELRSEAPAPTTPQRARRGTVRRVVYDTAYWQRVLHFSDQ